MFIVQFDSIRDITAEDFLSPNWGSKYLTCWVQFFSLNHLMPSFFPIPTKCETDIGASCTSLSTSNRHQIKKYVDIVNYPRERQHVIWVTTSPPNCQGSFRWQKKKDLKFFLMFNFGKVWNIFENSITIQLRFPFMFLLKPFPTLQQEI